MTFDEGIRQFREIVYTCSTVYLSEFGPPLFSLGATTQTKWDVPEADVHILKLTTA